MHSVLKLQWVVLIAACAAVAGCASPGLSADTKTVVTTDKAPKAIGPYSSGIRAGNLLFLSGQIAIDPTSNQFMSGTIEAETTLTLNNLKAVLEANGMTMANVVSTTVYLKDLNDFAKMNAVYATYFKEAPPARATLEVARIPRDAKVEIAAIAVK